MRSLPISHLYLGFFALVMMGYMALDKGFAYIGASPIFIGEITLALGFFVILTGAYSIRVFQSPIAWALAVFIMWNALRTLPFVDAYGLDALRDAVLWGYALFALVIAGILLKTHKLEAVPELYAKVIPGILVIGLAAFLITEIVGTGLPTWPGTDATIILVKASDLGVHTAGALAFFALGLHTVFPRVRRLRIPLADLVTWGLIVVCAIAVLSRSRGGFAAIACTGLFVTLFRPNNRMMRMAAPAIVVGVLFVTLNIEIPLQGGRSISPQQLVTNVLSIFGDQDKQSLDGTESWRLNWWDLIIQDVVRGDKFWLGRGYGISHAEVDGFTDITGNRSPHSAHINILGRAGVPGFISWIALLVTFYGVMTRYYLKARSEKRHELAALNLWVMAYSVPFLIAGAFDVYLEGPQGGIPFWCIIGYGIALSEAQRQSMARPQPPREPTTPKPPERPRRRRPQRPGPPRPAWA
ncbi:MAG: O-antigen ligase family protein [Alphaproteobacteria bacterium]